MPQEGAEEGKGGHSPDRTQMTAAVWGEQHLQLWAVGWTKRAGIQQEKEETSGVHLSLYRGMCVSGICPVNATMWRDEAGAWGCFTTVLLGVGQECGYSCPESQELVSGTGSKCQRDSFQQLRAVTPMFQVLWPLPIPTTPLFSKWEAAPIPQLSRVDAATQHLWNPSCLLQHRRKRLSFPKHWP